MNVEGEQTEAAIEQDFGRLWARGTALTPDDSYGFSTKYGWVNDRFGASWELNLS